MVARRCRSPATESEGRAAFPRAGLLRVDGGDNLDSTAFHNFTAAYPAASVISEMSLIAVSNVKNLQT
jgi:hypothetical protein